MFIVNLTEVYSLIRVRGANRADFLHRMSTGDLLGIQPGAGRTTVFTTPIGRMVDYAVVLAFPDSLLMMSGGNGQSKIVWWLRKYIFYNDDVQLTDETSIRALYGVFGQGATEFVESIAAGASRLALHSHITEVDAIVVAARPLEGQGYYLINPPADVIESQSVDAIPHYEDQRIMAGYPEFPHEISDEYIPLEAGLLEAVSFSKGCYIGQEIIARMESRGQLAKRLARLDVAGALTVGAELRSEQALAGKVTSVSSDGRAALGYVRSAFALPGQQLRSGKSVVTIHIPV